MVMVVRAWVEEGRAQGFRARVLQTEAPGGATGDPGHVVTTSIDQTVDAIRAWLEALSGDESVPPREDEAR
jgi:hypothetical protein